MSLKEEGHDNIENFRPQEVGHLCLSCICIYNKAFTMLPHINLFRASMFLFIIMQFSKRSGLPMQGCKWSDEEIRICLEGEEHILLAYCTFLRELHVVYIMLSM